MEPAVALFHVEQSAFALAFALASVSAMFHVEQQAGAVRVAFEFVTGRVTYRVFARLAPPAPTRSLKNPGQFFAKCDNSHT